MTFQSLKDVYIDQMQDLYSADLQALPATRKLGEKASNSELKDALERSCNGIEKGMEILSSIIKGHEADPRGECCKERPVVPPPAPLCRSGGRAAAVPLSDRRGQVARVSPQWHSCRVGDVQPAARKMAKPAA